MSSANVGEQRVGGKPNAAAAVGSTARSSRLSPAPASARLTLLGGFDLVCDGVPVALPMSAQRVIAFVATHDRPIQRAYVAGSLWLETPESRAHANLRSALWRLQRARRTLVETNGQQLRLSPARLGRSDRGRGPSPARTRPRGPRENSSSTGSRSRPDLSAGLVRRLDRPAARALPPASSAGLDVLCVRLTDEGRLMRGDGGRPRGRGQ